MKPASLAAPILAVATLLGATPARAEEAPTPTPRAGAYAAAGAGIFAASYGLTASSTLLYRADYEQTRPAAWLYVPVVGPWIALGEGQIHPTTMLGGRLGHHLREKGWDKGCDASICSSDLVTLPVYFAEVMTLALLPLAQAGGLTLAALGGTKALGQSPEGRSTVALAPTWSGGPGLALTVVR